MSFLNLKNFWQTINRDKLLLLALLVGLLLRGLNPTFGSPSLYISNDEAIAHLSALNMIAYKSPISISNYTPLGAYLQIPFLVGSFVLMKVLGLVNGLGDFELFILTHEGYLLFIPRLISALFGTLIILVIYKITLTLFVEKRVATISAFLTAVSFNLVHISHFGRPWSPALFFILLGIYLVLRNKILASYISVGIAFGFHQVGVLAMPLIFWRASKKLTFGNFLSVIPMILMIVIFSSLTLKTGLIESIGRDQSFLKAGKFAADFLIGNSDLVGSALRSFWGNLSVYFIVNLLVTDGIIFLFGVWGIIKNFAAKDQKREIVYYILSYFIIASLFFHPLIRYLLPVVLLSIPFAALSIDSIFGGKSYLIVPILILASVNSLWWNLLYIKKPTFISAAEWINQNVASQTPIAYVGNRYRLFLPNKEAIIHVEITDKGFYKRLLGSLPSDNYDNVRNIVYASNFPGITKLQNLRNATSNYKTLYIVDYYIDPVERLYYLAPEELEIVAHFNPTRRGNIVGIPEPLFDASWNFSTNDSRKKVSMYSLSNVGPFVDILRFRR